MVVDETDSNHDHDAETREDTESKISVVSNLGSELSDLDTRDLLDTDFESTTIPIIFRMLDKGCAWIEGQNCGFDVPSLLKESKSKSGTVGMHQYSVTYSSTILKKTPLVNKCPGPAIKKGATHIDQDPAASGEPDSMTNETTNNVSFGGDEQSDPEDHDSNTGDAEALEPEGGLESRETESTNETTNNVSSGGEKQSDPEGRRNVVNAVTILEPEDNVAHDSTENQIERSDPSDSSSLQPIDVTGVESVHNRRSVDPPRLLAGSEGEPTTNLLSLDDSPSSLRQANSKRKAIDPEKISDFLPAPTSSNTSRRKCGGPEELAPRSRHSLKSAETNEEGSRLIDSVMFKYLSEGERVAALELAQRLRLRAEKLKARKKKRETRMKHATGWDKVQ